jgi:DNA repair protein RecO (recombination protein O)
VLVVVWKRSDFRESSRLVTFLSRERGKFVALAKGAHRTGSALCGKLDFLNRCDATFAGRGLPLVGRFRLIHEPRALRRPPRFLAMSHLAEVLDAAFVAERPDPELFDLTLGALTLTEKAPTDRLPVVVAGIELRLLRGLGLCPDLLTCSQCGRPGTPGAPLAVAPTAGGLFCPSHRPEGARTVDPDVLAWLHDLGRTPGRRWPELPVTRQLGPALWVLGHWLANTLEFRPRTRALALRGP